MSIKIIKLMEGEDVFVYPEGLPLEKVKWYFTEKGREILTVEKSDGITLSVGDTISHINAKLERVIESFFIRGETIKVKAKLKHESDREQHKEFVVYHINHTKKVNTKKVNKMKVTKTDLKGYIKNFPLEIVQKMCDYQVDQGNEFDPSVFSLMARAGHSSGGFDWCNTEEGIQFWEYVIGREAFDEYFNYYPKTVNVYDVEDEMENKNETKESPYYRIVKMLNDQGDEFFCKYTHESALQKVKDRGYKILSVKRLSDGKLFYIGDEVSWTERHSTYIKGKIKEFTPRGYTSLMVTYGIDYKSDLPYIRLNEQTTITKKQRHVENKQNNEKGKILNFKTATPKIARGKGPTGAAVQSRSGTKAVGIRYRSYRDRAVKG